MSNATNERSGAPALIPGIRARYWLLLAALGAAAWWWSTLEPESEAIRQAKRDLTAAEARIEENPKDLEARGMRTAALIALGRYEDCLAECARVLEIEPGTAWAHTGRGWALRGLKQPGRAMEACRKALAIEPRRGDSNYLHAMLLLDQGLLEQSLRAFDRALEVKQDAAYYHMNRGVVLMRLARPRDALPSFDRAVGLAPADRLTHYNRGYALRVLGKFREAQHSLRRALEIDPDFEAAQRDLEFVDEIVMGQDMVESVFRGVSELVERHQ